MRAFPILLAAMLAAPARAEVAASSEAGFVSHHEVLIDRAPAQVWAELVKPAGWWNGEHSYSGNAANMTIDPVAGGCFCEALPGPPRGQIEHGRVLYAAPNSTLRLSGALGPLQAEAVTAVLTMTLTAQGEQTRIVWDYVVGGYSRQPLASLAPVVDQVIGEQLLRLSARLGRVVDPAPRRL